MDPRAHDTGPDAAAAAVAHRRWILAALMLTMMLAAMDTTIVSTAIPQVVGDLGGFALFSWVFSIYLLAQTVTIPVYGKLADTFGRKPVLIVGSLVFLAGSAASAGAWNMVTLIIFRGLQGLGAGATMATVNTLAGDLYSVRERARVQGWLSSVWGIASVLGPTLGGSFAQYVSWRWIFVINLPIGAVAIVLIGRFLHEDVRRRAHHIDYRGSVLMLATGGALIFGLLQGGQAWRWFSWPSVLVFAVTAVLAAVTVWAERRAAEPVMPGWIWRRRALAGANAAMIGLGLILMGPNTYLPTYAQAVLGLGAIAAGLVLATMSIGWPTASAFAGQLYLRLGFRDTALIGSGLVVAATAGFLALPFPAPVWLVVVDQVVLGAGFGLLSTSMLVGVQSTVTWSDRGVVTGANMFSRYLGQSVGAAVFGAISNAAIARRLADAPAALRGRLPGDVNQISDVLGRRARRLPPAAEDYLRRTLSIATHHVYVGLLVTAVLTVLVVVVTPRRFGVVADERQPDAAARR